MYINFFSYILFLCRFSLPDSQGGICDLLEYSPKHSLRSTWATIASPRFSIFERDRGCDDLNSLNLEQEVPRGRILTGKHHILQVDEKRNFSFMNLRSNYPCYSYILCFLVSMQHLYFTNIWIIYLQAAIPFINLFPTRLSLCVFPLNLTTVPHLYYQLRPPNPSIPSSQTSLYKHLLIRKFRLIRPLFKQPHFWWEMVRGFLRSCGYISFPISSSISCLLL